MNAEELADKLNAYEGGFNDLWFHVIRELDDYNDAATDVEDLSCTGEVVVLTSGESVWLDHEQHMWVASPHLKLP